MMRCLFCSPIAPASAARSPSFATTTPDGSDYACRHPAFAVCAAVSGWMPKPMPHSRPGCSMRPEYTRFSRRTPTRSCVASRRPSSTDCRCSGTHLSSTSTRPSADRRARSATFSGTPATIPATWSTARESPSPPSPTRSSISGASSLRHTRLRWWMPPSHRPRAASSCSVTSRTLPGRRSIGAAAPASGGSSSTRMPGVSHPASRSAGRSSTGWASLRRGCRWSCGTRDARTAWTSCSMPSA